MTRRRRTRANALVRADYTREAWVTGPLQPPPAGSYQVAFRRVGGRRRHLTLMALVLLNVAVSAAFITWVLRPAHVPAHGEQTAFWLVLVAQVGFASSSSSNLSESGRACRSASSV